MARTHDDMKSIYMFLKSTLQMLKTVLSFDTSEIIQVRKKEGCVHIEKKNYAVVHIYICEIPSSQC